MPAWGNKKDLYIGVIDTTFLWYDARFMDNGTAIYCRERICKAYRYTSAVRNWFSSQWALDTTVLCRLQATVMALYQVDSMKNLPRHGISRSLPLNAVVIVIYKQENVTISTQHPIETFINDVISTPTEARLTIFAFLFLPRFIFLLITSRWVGRI